MAAHLWLSLHDDHPYCIPPCLELLLWHYPQSLIPEALRLLRLGNTPSPYYPAFPVGDIIEL
ncbi:host cell factor C1 regulator 1-like [Mus musculus]|uniref:host cell factor C1 regulator 1-like n=1 Tax=Mus musculus TaxID=10090 RepID=UPI0011AE8435|nr:host cell factor C1 regulator 1-like [Mus musculus]